VVADPQADNPITPPVQRSRRRIRVWEMTVLAVLTVCFGIVIGAGGVFLKYRDRIAPRPRFDEGMLWRIVHEMRGRYDLTDDQVQKVRETFRTQFEKMRALRTEIEQQMEQIRAELIVQMKDILDAEQFKQWRRDLEKMQQRGGWRRPRGQGQGPPTPDQMIRRATESLDLTDEQKAAMRRIAEKYDKAFKDNQDPQKGPELFKKMWEEVDAVLTEAQRKKMQERMSRFGSGPGRGRGGPGSRNQAGPGRGGPRFRGEPGPGPQGTPPDQGPPAGPPPEQQRPPSEPPLLPVPQDRPIEPNRPPVSR